MTIHCPCCNQALPAAHAPIEALDAAPWSPLERRIIGALSRAYPRHLTLDQIVDLIYADDPNGGPEKPRPMILNVFWKIRPRLKSYGWHVPNAHHGRGNLGRYRLEPLERSNG